MNKLIQKISVGVATTALLVTSFAGPALAAGKAAPKATGGIGYTAYDIQRYAQFDAQQSTVCSAMWNVTNTYSLNTIYLSNTYTYSLNVSQAGNTVTGTLTDPYLPGVLTVENGTVSGNTIVFSVDYGLGSVQGVRTFTGTITSGVLSGTWSETGSEAGADTWSTSGSIATSTTGCTGKGMFNYSDVSGYYYTVDVRYVKVSGNQTWFAGPVVAGNVGAGQWLFAKVLDGGTPGSAGDQIWGSFTTQSAAIAGVAAMSVPGDGSFQVTSGNLVVH